MLCKCHWIVLYTVHFTAFCLGGCFFPDTVYGSYVCLCICLSVSLFLGLHNISSSGLTSMECGNLLLDVILARND